MPRIVHAGHGNWLKGTRRGAGTLMRSRRPYQGFALEFIVCLGLLALGLGIRVVGTSVL